VLAGLVLRPRALLSGSNLPLALFWVLSLAGLCTIAKEGAAQNYFIEPYLATLLLAAIALGALGDAGDVGPRAWPNAVLVAAAVVLLASRHLNHLPQAIRAPERAHAFVALDEAVKATEGPILSENLSVLVTNRRRVWVEPWGVMLLGKKGLWDPRVLIGDCRREMFALVVTETRLREIPGLSECLDETYEPWKDLGPYQLFRPRQPPGPREVVRTSNTMDKTARPFGEAAVSAARGDPRAGRAGTAGEHLARAARASGVLAWGQYWRPRAGPTNQGETPPCLRPSKVWNRSCSGSTSPRSHGSQGARRTRPPRAGS